MLSCVKLLERDCLSLQRASGVCHCLCAELCCDLQRGAAVECRALQVHAVRGAERDETGHELGAGGKLRLGRGQSHLSVQHERRRGPAQEQVLPLHIESVCRALFPLDGGHSHLSAHSEYAAHLFDRLH